MVVLELNGFVGATHRGTLCSRYDGTYVFERGENVARLGSTK